MASSVAAGTSFLLVCFLLGLSIGRKAIDLKRNPPVSKPRLKGFDSTICVWDPDWSSDTICLDYEVDLTLGWEFLQTWTDAEEDDGDTGTTELGASWQFFIQPYVETSFYFHPEMDFDELFFWEVDVELEKFKAGVFAEVGVYDDGYICLNIGRTLEQILFQIEMSMRFEDCQKDIIDNSIFDFMTLWGILDLIRGDEQLTAISECSPSYDETISIFTWEPVADDETYYYIPNQGESYDYTTCFPGSLGYSFPADIYLQSAIPQSLRQQITRMFMRAAKNIFSVLFERPNKMFYRSATD